MIGDPAEWDRRRGPCELAGELDAALDAAPEPGGAHRGPAAVPGPRDLPGRRPLDPRPQRRPESFSAELSDVAEVLLRASYRAAARELESRIPRRADGRAVPSALCALGKCGGRSWGSPPTSS
jgi:hypothetical protein